MTKPGPQQNDEHDKDKFALVIIAGMVVAVLGGVVWGTFESEGVPDKGDVLLGGLVTGLILFLRDIVAAIRASWAEFTQSKTMDQLAKSGPANEKPTVPHSAAEGARQAADAADEEAADLEERTKP